jgi:protein SCO1/2
MSDESGRDGSTKRRGGVLRNPWVWAFFIGIVTLTLMRPLLRHEPPPPPVIGELPEFRLIDQEGRPFANGDLDGRVWVANFIFTRCASICPLLTASMRRLQRRYDEEGVEGIGLVSFTVDPEYDTPERLKEYAARHGVRPERWTFVTGEPDAIRALVVEGFKTAMGERETPGEGLIDIAHTGKFVIVDGTGGIRGYYDSDELGLDEIFHRSQHVLKAQRQ